MYSAASPVQEVPGTPRLDSSLLTCGTPSALVPDFNLEHTEHQDYRIVPRTPGASSVPTTSSPWTPRYASNHPYDRRQLYSQFRSPSTSLSLTPRTLGKIQASPKVAHSPGGQLVPGTPIGAAIPSSPSATATPRAGEHYRTPSTAGDNMKRTPVFQGTPTRSIHKWRPAPPVRSLVRSSFFNADELSGPSIQSVRAGPSSPFPGLERTPTRAGPAATPVAYPRSSSVPRVSTRRSTVVRRRRSPQAVPVATDTSPDLLDIISAD